MKIYNVGLFGSDLLKKLGIGNGVHGEILHSILHKEYGINFLELPDKDVFSGIRAVDILLISLPKADWIFEIADKNRKPVIFFGADKTDVIGSILVDLPVSSKQENLVELIAESNEALLEKYCETGELSDNELISGLREAFKSRHLFPIVSGKNALLDFIVNFAPSSEEILIKSIDGEEVVIDSERLVAFVFKTKFEQAGKLSYVRVFSGVLKNGEDIYNSTKKNNERVGKIISAENLKTGDIGVVFKLKNAQTGDTLVADKKDEFELSALELPKPLIDLAIELVEGKESKLSEGIQLLAQEDLTFSTTYNSDTKQTIISGKNEAHLRGVVEQLTLKFNLKVKTSYIKIPYRETIRGGGEAKYRHKKQTGGAGQFAEVWLRIEPKNCGDGIEFKNSLTGQNVDRVYVSSVEKGIRQACEDGVFAGYKVVDLAVDFYDGKMHSVDSNDVAFQIAGKEAFKEAFMKAKPILLEPIYRLRIEAPEKFMGDIMGDISNRRGKIRNTEFDSTGNQIIEAEAPLKEILGYCSVLESITKGQGRFEKEFSRYEELPSHLAIKVIEEAKK